MTNDQRERDRAEPDDRDADPVPPDKLRQFKSHYPFVVDDRNIYDGEFRKRSTSDEDPNARS